MPISFNGNTPDAITFNGNDVETVVYNGDTVWTKPPTTYTVSYTNLFNNSSYYSYFTYKGSNKTGSGSIQITAGDSITVKVMMKRGVGAITGKTIARVYLNNRNVAESQKSGPSVTASTTYTYTPTSDCSLRGRESHYDLSGDSNIYSYCYITT